MTFQKMTDDLIATSWRPPKADNVRVKFRNGQISKHTYRPDQLNWSNRNYDFDITHWKDA
jgi:hypothetical protein